MSMWLSLVKIEPSLLTEIREEPELIHSLFFDEDDDSGPRLPGFRPTADSYGDDYRTLVAIAEGRAGTEEGTEEWRDAYPWLARTTGDSCEIIEGYEFCYGPAFFLTADEVRQVAEGLVAEGWTGGPTAGDVYEENDGEENDGEENDDYENDEYDDLGRFFAAAAAEGKAVIGGVA